ncbi:polymer-forming cytoskeletal protein [Phaeovibrio sulfidiphilus]|uniref:bactofilin family protein n=1 Tax=Phaeovibrio sulfidiphilus TaxID=1220600 RepID=UPI0030841467
MPSIVSGDLVVTGDLHSSGEIQIDGRVEGDIECVSLIIGISGNVTGEVKAEKLRLHGSVSGHVSAKSVFLASTARIMGDISHESLAVEPGAYIEGHCRRLTTPVEVQPPAPSFSVKLASSGGSEKDTPSKDDSQVAVG